MKFTAAAILAFGVSPVSSLSYLESLTGGAPPAVSAAPPQSVEAPFFFTNGAGDEPAGPSPPFFFTNGAEDQPAANSASYMDNLVSAGAVSVSGPGMASYLDALPQSNNSPTGSGLQSYAASLDSLMAPPVVPSAPVPPVVESAPAAPVAPVAEVYSAPGDAIANPMAYLDALGGASDVGGPGLTSYLDALPRESPIVGGAGISSYASNLAASNVVSGGEGMPSYAASLSPEAAAAAPQSYAPSSYAPDAASESATGRFEFSINADAEFVEQLMQAGDRRVRLTGRLN